MKREGGAVTCDGRLFHRQAAATGNALSPTVDRRVRQTSRDVDEVERSRRLASVFAGRHSSSHRKGFFYPVLLMGNFINPIATTIMAVVNL